MPPTTAGRRSTTWFSICRSIRVDSRRAQAAGAAAGPNGEILVVGVGTGLELPLLPPTTRVTGIDLSRGMLDVARERVRRKGMRHVQALREMDAGALDFNDANFDVALAPFVMSVVPEPARVLEEMWRVVRPGGELILINHFAAERGWRVGIETGMDSFAAWLGWHPRFPYAAVGDWLAANPQARLLERRELPPLQLVHAAPDRQGLGVFVKTFVPSW